MGSGCGNFSCNSIVFPRPKVKPKDKESYEKCPNIMYIPTRRDTNIPCMKITFPQNPPDYVILFFHANCEDIFRIRIFLCNLSYDLGVNILCPEYQGYSTYKGSPNELDILSDAEDVYKELITKDMYLESHISIMGRSLGCGPSVWIAATYNPGSLVLISGFTSLKAAGKHNVGCLAGMLRDRFINREHIHKKDKVVPFAHSKRMALEQEKTNSNVRCNFPLLMSHNTFDFTEDYIVPIKDFYEEFGIIQSENPVAEEYMPESLPESVRDTDIQTVHVVPVPDVEPVTLTETPLLDQ